MLIIKILLAATICSWPLSADLSIQNIEKMVKDIHAKRVSKVEEHGLLSSPFTVVKVDKNASVEKSVPIDKKKDVSFSLGAIMNSSAFIDGSWYKKGDKLDDFQIDKIGDDFVDIKKKNHKITLFFKGSKNLLNIGKEQ